MTYSIDVFSEEPIMVARLYADFSLARDMVISVDDTREVLDSLAEPVFYVLDLSEAEFDVNDVVAGANGASRGEAPIWHHHNIRGFVVVSRNKLIQLAAKGLNSMPFGNLEARVFEDLDKALAYCREEILAG